MVVNSVIQMVELTAALMGARRVESTAMQLVDLLVDSLEPPMAEMKVDSSASNLVEKMVGCWEHYSVGQSGSQWAGWTVGMRVQM